MKHILLFVMLFPSVHAQITANVYARVLSVRVNGSSPDAVTATMFSIEVDGRQYLITARHVGRSQDESAIPEAALSSDYKLLGVVSGFRVKFTPVLEKRGGEFKVANPARFIAENTGIMRGYAIEPDLRAGESSLPNREDLAEELQNSSGTLMNRASHV